MEATGWRHSLTSGDSLRVRLARGAFWSLVGTLALHSFPVLASIAMAQVSGRHGLGELGMLTSTVGMMGVFAGLGLGLTATKYVAEYQHTRNSRAGRIIGLSLLAAFVWSCAIGAVLLVFARPLADQVLNAPQLATELRLSTLLLVLNAVGGAQAGALAGLEKFKSLALSNLLRGTVSVPFLIAWVVWWKLPGAVSALILHAALGVVAQSWLLRTHCKDVGIAISFRPAEAEWKLVHSFSIPALISAAMVSPITWLTNAMLTSHPGGYGELGALNAVTQWRNVLLLIPAVAAQASVPVVSSFAAKGDGESIRRTLRTSALANAAYLLPCVFALIVLRKPLLTLYGPEFDAYGVLLVVSALTAGIQGLLTPVGSLIVGVGRMWSGAFMNIGWAAVVLGAGWSLSRAGSGALGIASAFLIGYIVHGSWSCLYVAHILGPAERHR